MKHTTNLADGSDLGKQDHIFEHTVWTNKEDAEALMAASNVLHPKHWNTPNGLYGLNVVRGPGFRGDLFFAAKRAGSNYLEAIQKGGGSFNLYKVKTHSEPEIGLHTFEHDPHDSDTPGRNHPGSEVASWGHV